MTATSSGLARRSTTAGRGQQQEQPAEPRRRRRERGAARLHDGHRLGAPECVERRHDRDGSDCARKVAPAATAETRRLRHSTSARSTRTGGPIQTGHVRNTPTPAMPKIAAACADGRSFHKTSASHIATANISDTTCAKNENRANDPMNSRRGETAAGRAPIASGVRRRSLVRLRAFSSTANDQKHEASLERDRQRHQRIHRVQPIAPDPRAGQRRQEMAARRVVDHVADEQRVGRIVRQAASAAR